MGHDLDRLELLLSPPDLARIIRKATHNPATIAVESCPFSATSTALRSSMLTELRVPILGPRTRLRGRPVKLSVTTGPTRRQLPSQAYLAYPSTTILELRLLFEVLLRLRGRARLVS